MTLEYANEKLTQAVRTLAVGSGRIQERLTDAALILIRLRPGDIPEGPLRRSLQGIIDDLTFEQAKGEEGNISATLQITDDEDARAIANRVVDLFLFHARR